MAVRRRISPRALVRLCPPRSGGRPGSAKQVKFRHFAGVPLTGHPDPHDPDRRRPSDPAARTPQSPRRLAERRGLHPRPGGTSAHGVDLTTKAGDDTGGHAARQRRIRFPDDRLGLRQEERNCDKEKYRLWCFYGPESLPADAPGCLTPWGARQSPGVSKRLPWAGRSEGLRASGVPRGLFATHRLRRCPSGRGQWGRSWPWRRPRNGQQTIGNARNALPTTAPGPTTARAAVEAITGKP